MEYNTHYNWFPLEYREEITKEQFFYEMSRFAAYGKKRYRQVTHNVDCLTEMYDWRLGNENLAIGMVNYYYGYDEGYEVKFYKFGKPEDWQRVYNEQAALFAGDNS